MRGVARQRHEPKPAVFPATTRVTLGRSRRHSKRAANFDIRSSAVRASVRPFEGMQSDDHSKADVLMMSNDVSYVTFGRPLVRHQNIGHG